MKKLQDPGLSVPGEKKKKDRGQGHLKALLSASMKTVSPQSLPTDTVNSRRFAMTVNY